MSAIFFGGKKEIGVANDPEISERARNLLKVLVERYIQDGCPVGSRALARDSGLNLSPATIRNVMADLEHMGLVKSPHTSAGRVPTVTGYRMFVDGLLSVKPLNKKEIDQLSNDLFSRIDSEDLLKTASRLLSEVSRMAGVVSVPKPAVVSFRHIEFLPLSQARVLVILVTDEKEVQNKIINTSRPFTPADLQQAANFLNDIFEGQDLVSVRKRVLKDMQDTRERMNEMMFDAIQVAHLAFSEDKKKDDFVMSGETNLMEFNDLADMDRLRQLFDAFSKKRGIIHLLDRCLDTEGVQIFIGEESGYDALESCSLVSSSYSVDDQVVGVLGVIGPTRMEYERVIPLVDVTAKLLGAALDNKTSSPS